MLNKFLYTVRIAAIPQFEKMFGYVGSTKFNESHIWDYASIVIFEEAGCSIKTYRAKVFDKDLVKTVVGFEIGQQIYFQIKATTRGDRTYIQITHIREASFTSCQTCGRAELNGKCISCTPTTAERLIGEFRVVDVSELENATKLVLRQEELQFTYIQWSKDIFGDQKFSVGDTVVVCGWRDENRITQLRELFKKEESDDD